MVAITLAISLVIHLFLFLIFSRVPAVRTITVSDIAFQDVAEPPERSIPRPRPMTDQELTHMDDLKDIADFRPNERITPPAGPVKTDATAQRVSAAMFAGQSDDGAVGGESISVPVVPAVQMVAYNPNLSQWNPRDIGNIATDFSTPQTYLDMVKIKIERYKEYPEPARSRRMEGTVTIRFILTLNGEVKDTQIVKSSKYGVLDEAALKALQDAVPFPKPPTQLFKRDIPLQIDIVFELT
jgi:protein TonB